MEKKIFSVPLGILILGFGAFLLVISPYILPKKDNTKIISWHAKRFGSHAWMTFWPLSHLVIYFIISLFFPEYWFFLFNFGVAWEVLEITLKRLIEDPKQWKESYWYANLFDIIMNSIGIFIGTCLGMIWKSRKNKKTQTLWIKLLYILLIVSVIILFVDDQHYYISRDPNGAYKQCHCRKQCEFIEKNGHLSSF